MEQEKSKNATSKEKEDYFKDVENNITLSDYQNISAKGNIENNNYFSKPQPSSEVGMEDKLFIDDNIGRLKDGKKESL